MVLEGSATPSPTLPHKVGGNAGLRQFGRRGPLGVIARERSDEAIQTEAGAVLVWIASLRSQ
jgi:hypothetical protein